MLTFNSDVTNRGSFPSDFTQEQIKNEPMLFNCDRRFAEHNGGPITRAFLAALPLDWRENVVIDSRVHMLMPGWTPCIPGWHHDDVPRSAPNDQPNYHTPEYESEHLMGLVNGNIAPTKFILGRINVPEVEADGTVYEQWSIDINRQIAVGDHAFETWSALSGLLLEFNSHAFHTGVPAVGSGWRWFIRLSRKTERVNKITNELRRQVQVYLEFPEKGW